MTTTIDTSASLRRLPATAALACVVALACSGVALAGNGNGNGNGANGGGSTSSSNAGGNGNGNGAANGGGSNPNAGGASSNAGGNGNGNAGGNGNGNANGHQVPSAPSSTPPPPSASPGNGASGSTPTAGGAPASGVATGPGSAGAPGGSTPGSNTGPIAAPPGGSNADGTANANGNGVTSGAGTSGNHDGGPASTPGIADGVHAEPDVGDGWGPAPAPDDPSLGGTDSGAGATTATPPDGGAVVAVTPGTSEPPPARPAAPAPPRAASHAPSLPAAPHHAPRGQLAAASSAPTVRPAPVVADLGVAGRGAKLAFRRDGVNGRPAVRVTSARGVTTFAFMARGLVRARRIGNAYRIGAWLRSDTPGLMVCLRIAEVRRSDPLVAVRTTERCMTPTAAWQHFRILRKTVARGDRLVFSVYSYGTTARDSFEIEGFTVMQKTASGWRRVRDAFARESAS